MHIRTFTGRLVDPFNPQLADIQPHAMLHALSQLNRFTGHCVYPYSVGKHTLNLLKYVRNVYPYGYKLHRAAIVHDLSEAWFNDVASPVKRGCPSYKMASHRAQAYINTVFRVSDDTALKFDEFDKRIYMNERNALVRIDPAEPTGLGDDLKPLLLVEFDFEESYWRDVRSRLWAEFDTLFPEWAECQ